MQKRAVFLAVMITILGMLSSCTVQEIPEGTEVTFAEFSIACQDEQTTRLQRNLALWYHYQLVSENPQDDISQAYRTILFYEDGVMGALEISKIIIPIYHGISEEVLKRGVGHLPDSAFPLGIKGQVSVLIVDGIEPPQLDAIVYLHILGERDAYCVSAVKQSLSDDLRLAPCDLLLIVRNGREKSTYLLCDRIEIGDGAA